MNNYFNLALGVSLCVHILLLGGIPFNIINFEKKSFHQPKTEFINEQPKELLRLAKDTSFKEPPPYLDLKKDILDIQKTKERIFTKPETKNSLTNIKEVVFLKSKDDMDSFPAYINYYEEIREKVKNAAYNSFRSRSTGRIYLNFTLDNSGNLVNIYLNNSTSTSSAILKRVAKDSVETSSPFPKFPKELGQFKTLTFNLAIHFKSN